MTRRPVLHPLFFCWPSGPWVYGEADAPVRSGSRPRREPNPTCGIPPPPPATRRHRHRADSAALYVRLPAFEPLHLREGANAPFQFSLDIELLVEPTEWRNAQEGEPPATMLHRFRWKEKADPGRTDLVQRFVFPMPIGHYRIVHTVRDRNRGSDVTGVTLLDGWSQDAPVRNLAVNLDTGEPVWGHGPADPPGSWLIPADRLALTLNHVHLHPVDSFLPHPFWTAPRHCSSRIPPAPSDRADSPAQHRAFRRATGTVGAWSNGQPMRGPPVDSPRRRTAHGSWPHGIPFPVMRDVDELIRATRYRHPTGIQGNARRPESSGPSTPSGLAWPKARKPLAA